MLDLMNISFEIPYFRKHTTLFQPTEDGENLAPLRPLSPKNIPQALHPSICPLHQNMYPKP